jgi:hypothetical protein
MFVARSRLFSTVVEAVSRFKDQHRAIHGLRGMAYEAWLTRHGLRGMAYELRETVEEWRFSAA